MRHFVALSLLAALAVPGHAYVEALYPLQQVLNESEVIAEGTVEKVDAKNKTAVIKITKSLKGKCGYEQVRMNFGAGQVWHPEAIMKHLVVGAPALVFYNQGRQGEVYLNRFFFQLYGDAAAAPDKAWWTFTHIEIRMNRTFNGTVPELSKLVGEIIGGKAKAPAPDAKIPPIGPEHVKALPAHGEEIKEESLPAPFVKRAAKLGKPREPETPAKVAKGLQFQYYEGQWTAIPDFDKLTPVKTGKADQVDVSPKGREIHFGLRFTGFLEVPKEGVYTFHTSSNDGSKLFIGKTPVVENDHHHGVVEADGEIALKAGKHSLTVLYFQEGGQAALEVHWAGPDLPRQKIPAQNFFQSVP